MFFICKKVLFRMSLFIKSLKKDHHDEETLKETKNKNKSFFIKQECTTIVRVIHNKTNDRVKLKKKRNLYLPRRMARLNSKLEEN